MMPRSINAESLQVLLLWILTGPAAGSYRVGRGGSWRSNARRCRSAFRFYHAPDNRSASLGFRLLRMLQ